MNNTEELQQVNEGAIKPQKNSEIPVSEILKILNLPKEKLIKVLTSFKENFLVDLYNEYKSIKNTNCDLINEKFDNFSSNLIQSSRILKNKFQVFDLSYKNEEILKELMKSANIILDSKINLKDETETIKNLNANYIEIAKEEYKIKYFIANAKKERIILDIVLSKLTDFYYSNIINDLKVDKETETVENMLNVKIKILSKNIRENNLNYLINHSDEMMSLVFLL